MSEPKERRTESCVRPFGSALMGRPSVVLVVYLERPTFAPRARIVAFPAAMVGMLLVFTGPKVRRNQVGVLMPHSFRAPNPFACHGCVISVL